MQTGRRKSKHFIGNIFVLISIMFCVFIGFVSCDNSPVVQEPPQRIEKEAKTEEKTVAKVYDEDAGEGNASLYVSFNGEAKALYSDHNTSYDYFLLNTEYLSNRRDGSSITGVFEDFKMPAGSDGSRENIDLGFFTQGRWKFSIKASNSDGDILYLGSAETYITAGADNSVTINMEENTEDVGKIVLDVMSLTVPLPRIVVSYTKVWNGDGEKILLDTGGDGKGLVMETLDTGYTTYKTPEIIMPAGAYYIKVQLWAGEDIFSGEILDTFIVPRKTTTISGIFTITGLADFIRVNPDERYTFCEACERFEIPTGKMITGFHLLGSTGLVDFPYKNETETLQYLIPVYEDVSTYFNLSGSNALTLAQEYPYKYAGFNTGYPDSPIEFTESLFAGTESALNEIKAVYSPSTVIIDDSAFAYSNIEELRLGTINKIGAYAFKGAKSFSDFGEGKFTNSITIGTGAFEESGIAYIDIPSGATVGTGLFKNADKLFRISFYYPSIPEDTFNGCGSLTQVNLNSDATIIGDRAFKGCSSLESITLPDALTKIGDNAFEGCSGLTKTITIGKKIKSIGTDAFKGCDTLDELYITVTCGDLAGEPWGLADSSKITYWAYKIFFDSNLPADYEKAEGEEEFPMLLEKFGETLPSPIADPKYRLVGYNDVFGNTLDGYEIPIPLIDGYALRGWFTDPAAGEEITQLTLNTIKQNRTVYAHWVRGLITVVFSGGRGGNDNTGKSTETYRMVRYQGYYGVIGEEDEEDDHASPLPTATIEGRDFLGWYFEQEPMLDDISPDETEQTTLTAVVDSTEVATKKSHTLYAHYRDHRYTVQFDVNLPTNAKTYGQRNGVNVYSSYVVPESYTAIYNQQYNKRFDASLLTSTGYRGETVALPDLNSDAYKLDNYYFIGWYLEPECINRVYDNTRVGAQETNGDTITLYAKWIGKEKTVNYVSRYKAHPADTNYTETTVVSTKQRFTAPLGSTDAFRSYFNKKVVTGKETQIEYDSAYSFSVPTRTGYSFVAWWNGFNDTTNKVSGEKMIDGVITSGTVTEVNSPGTQKIYAEWKANTYTVKFDAQGGSVSTSSKVVTYDSKYGELPTPTKSGYIFTGWYTTTVRTGGYGYQNSEAYINSDSWVRTAANHTLYAAWSAVIVVDGSATTSTPLNTTVNFNPVSNGGQYGSSNNIASQNVSIKTVKSLNTIGKKDSSGNWVNANAIEAAPNQKVTLSVSNGYLSTSSSVTTGSDGKATVTISTTASAIPSSQKVTAKTISSSVTDGIINVGLKGALTSLTLSSSSISIYVRNSFTITATLKSTDGNGNLHYSNTNLSFTVGATDSYCTSSVSGARTGSQSFTYRAGYTVISGVKLTAKEATSGLTANATVNITQPKQTIKVANGSYVGSFFNNVAAIYNGYSTAKAQWLITGFRDWEGGDPTSSATETTVSTTTRTPGTRNRTGHAIYLYPIKSGVYKSSYSRSGSYSNAYIAFPTNVKYIGTDNTTVNYSNACKVYIAGSNVTIARYAFKGNKNSLEFKIAGSIQTVGDHAFLDCSGLYGITEANFKKMTSIGEEGFQSAKIGNAVTLNNCSLGRAAFAYAKLTSLSSNTTSYQMCYGSSVKTINITASEIAQEAFYNCDSLSTIVLGGVTNIGAYAFAYCDNNFSISWGSKVKTIGNFAFYYCTGKTSISFPSTLESMGYASFAECYALTTISFSGCSKFYTIPDSCFFNDYKLTTISNWGAVNTIGNSRVFMQCGFSGSLSIPSQVTYIGNQAFKDCNNLTSVTIEGNGVNVREYAFYSCDNLTSVKFSSSSKITLCTEAFAYCGKLSTVDFLSMGSNFNSSSFGSNVWYSCALRYVKLTQNCFPSDSYCVQSDGYVTYEGTCASSYYYFRVPCVQFNSNSWCDGYWSWFSTHYCSNHSHSVSYKGYLGSNFSWTSSSASNFRANGCHIEGKASFWTGGWHDQGTYSIYCYEIGNSEATTAYNYIAGKGYKFAGGSDSAYSTSNIFNVSDYCNSYVYPGTSNLKHLIPIP